MTTSAEMAATAMSKAKTFDDYTYLNKRGVYGRYEVEVQALKFNDAGKPIVEAKILKATKTEKDSEPHREGTVVSYMEDISKPKNGGAGRLLKALLAVLQMTEADISTLEEKRDGKTVELQGENAKQKWLIKMMDQVKQPTAFMRAVVEVSPRVVPPSDKGPGGTFSKETWSAVELDEKTLDEIDAKRKAANLPSIAEALK